MVLRAQFAGTEWNILGGLPDNPNPLDLSEYVKRDSATEIDLTEDWKDERPGAYMHRCTSICCRERWQSKRSDACVIRKRNTTGKRKCQEVAPRGGIQFPC